MTAANRGFTMVDAIDHQRTQMASPRLPETGFMRLPDIIGSRRTQPPTPAVIPVGRSTWYEGVKSGRFPQPVKGLGKRITAWRVEDIRALVDGLSPTNLVVKQSDHDKAKECANAADALQHQVRGGASNA